MKIRFSGYALALAALLCPQGEAIADSYEPNNTRAQASVLPEGQTQTHELYKGLLTGDTVDWLTFTVSADANVEINLVDADPSTLLGLISSSRVPSMTIVTSGQQTLGTYPAASSLTQLTRHNWQATLPAGQYYVRVTMDTQLISLGTQRYAITYNARAVSPDAFEPDNSFAYAVPIALGEVQGGHSIDPIDDIDVFTFTLTSPVYTGIATVQSVIAGGYDAGLVKFTLFNEHGVYIAEGNPIRVPLNAGTYYVVAEGPGRLVPWYSITVRDLHGPDAYESDDVLDGARLLGANGPTQLRTLHTPTDVDWIAVHAPASAISLVLETGISVRHLDVTLYRLVAGTLNIVGNVVGETTSLLGNLTGLRLDVSLPEPDVYYVRVSLANGAYSGAKSTETDPHYTIAAKSVGGAAGSIVGVVQDTAKKRIDEATVQVQQISGMKTWSDKDGVYVFEAVPGGNYSLLAGKQDYGQVTRSVSVKAYSIAQANFELPIVNPPVLAMESAGMTFNHGGGSGHAAVTNEGGLTLTWSAQVMNSAAWITLTRASGTQNEALQFTVAANTGAARTGYIQVTSPNASNGAKVFAVHQAAAPPPPPPPPPPDTTEPGDQGDSSPAPTVPDEPTAPVVPEPAEPEVPAAPDTDPGDPLSRPRYICIAYYTIPEDQTDDGKVVGPMDASHIQAVINAALGMATHGYDMNGDNVIDALDIQLVIKAVLAG